MHLGIRLPVAQRHRPDNPIIEGRGRAVVLGERTTRRKEILPRHHPNQDNSMTLETLAGPVQTMYKGRTANRPTTEVKVLNTKHRDSQCVILAAQTQVDEVALSKDLGVPGQVEKGSFKEDAIFQHGIFFPSCHFAILVFRDA